MDSFSELLLADYLAGDARCCMVLVGGIANETMRCRMVWSHLRSKVFPASVAVSLFQPRWADYARYIAYLPT